MGTFRTLIFDMGNVLISFSHEKMLKQVSNVSLIPLQTIQTLFLEEGLGLNLEKGETSPLEAYEVLLKIAPCSFDFDAFIEAGCNIFSSRPDMIKTVKQLKEQGFRLLLLSNTNIAHFEYIQKNFDFLPLFDHQILSFELKAVKPEKAIYEAALAQANTSAENCFYIDDIPEYVAAANELGIHGHVYKTYPHFIDSLKSQNILT